MVGIDKTTGITSNFARVIPSFHYFLYSVENDLSFIIIIRKMWISFSMTNETFENLSFLNT